MKCRSVRALLPEFVEGALSDSRRTAVELHLASCADCRMRAQECEMQLNWLGDAFKSAAKDAPEIPALAGCVVASLQSQTPARTGWFGWSLRPAAVFAVIAAVTSLAVTLFFQSVLDSTCRNAPEIRSGRQFAFTVRPHEDGRIESGIVSRRFARIEKPETEWPR